MVRRRTSARKKRTAYPALGAAPARRSGAWLLLILGALVVVNLYVFVWDKKTGVRAIQRQAEAHPVMAVPSQPLVPPPPPPAAVISPTVEGKVSKGDSLGKLLKHNGLSAAEADEVIRALSGVLDFRSIKAGQPFAITRGNDGRVTKFDLEVSKAHHVRAERAPTGELKGVAD